MPRLSITVWPATGPGWAGVRSRVEVKVVMGCGSWSSFRSSRSAAGPAGASSRLGGQGLGRRRTVPDKHIAVFGQSGRQVGDRLVLEEHLGVERQADLGRRVDDLDDLHRRSAQLEEVLAD